MKLVEPVDMRLKSDTPLTAYKWEAGYMDTCAPVNVKFAGLTSVQITGSFDNGCVDILGTLDGVTFLPLCDVDGRDLVFTDEGVKTLGDSVIAVKPSPEVGEKGKVSIVLITGSTV